MCDEPGETAVAVQAEDAERAIFCVDQSAGLANDALEEAFQ
jgi:hypothetical protein